MFRKSWDVKEFIGQYAQVRLVDKSSGDWGHIKFDELKGDIICPHYLDENNWRESKGTKDKRFSGFHLQIVTFGLLVSGKQAHHTQNEIEQNKKKTRLKPWNLKKPETITITKNADKSLNSI